MVRGVLPPRPRPLGGGALRKRPLRREGREEPVARRADGRPVAGPVHRPLPRLRPRPDGPDVPPRRDARLRERREPLLLRRGPEGRAARRRLRPAARLEGDDAAAAPRRRLPGGRLRRARRLAVRVRHPPDLDVPRGGRPAHPRGLGRRERGAAPAAPRPDRAREGRRGHVRLSPVRAIPLPRPPRARRARGSGAPRLAVGGDGPVHVRAGVGLPRRAAALLARALPRVEREADPPPAPRPVRLHEGGLHEGPLGDGRNHVVLRGAPPRPGRPPGAEASLRGDGEGAEGAPRDAGRGRAERRARVVRRLDPGLPTGRELARTSPRATTAGGC